ncbi:conserved hypothetical protein [Nitrosopumilaceae archaeon]|nr:conserved hypothetical protein [Nitrosopumilaceae archaeon]
MRRTMPVCLDGEQYRLAAAIAKKRGMVDAGQALEEILG